MKQWIVPISLAFVLTGCSAPAIQPVVDSHEGAALESPPEPVVDRAVQERQDIGTFVHNNAKSLANYAMKFAKSGDLTSEIQKLVDPAAGASQKAYLQGDDLAEMYAARQYAPIFVEAGGLPDSLSPLTDEFMRLASHGLKDRIHTEDWEAARQALAELGQNKLPETFEFTAEEEAQIADLIIERHIQVAQSEAVRDLMTELVKSETLMPRLHEAVVSRAKSVAQSAKQAAKLDVLTADLAMRFAREMAFDNMTHLSDEESALLSKTPTPKEYIPIAKARTRAWMDNLVAILDAPAPELKEKQEDHVPQVQLVAEKTEGAPTEEEKDEIDVTDAGVDETKDAHEAEAAAAEEQKQRLMNAHTVQELVDALYPAHPGYKLLMEARDKYAELEDWGTVSEVQLKRGRPAKNVPALRKRLAAEGYYQPESEEVWESDVYDDELRAAVRHYHDTHQIAYDENKGIQKTFWQSLNTPRTDRLEQIEENLRRWHKTQLIQSPYYIFINVPDFHGEVWKDGERVYRFPVVAGNARRSCDPKTQKWKYINATPLMHARMLYIEYNPYWIVPPRIEQEDYIEKINADPNWLKDHGFEYYTENGRTVLRQLPSEKNALGRVKFIFPNPNSTFLHDSPQKALFRYPVRSFSHGCMRVWEPLKLAELLLKLDGQWKDSITEEIEDLEPRRYMLKKRFDVFIDYFNVRVDENGLVYFLADPYHYVRDALHPPTEQSLKCEPQPRAWIPRTRGDVGADIE